MKIPIPKDANSALATVSLIRSIGTSISPAIMIGFIAHAGLGVQDNIMNIIGDPSTPKIVQVEELNSMITNLKSDPEMAKQLGSMSIPDLNSSSNNKIDMSSQALPDELLSKIQSSDVTNITDVVKLISSTMYNKQVPPVIATIESNVQKGIDGTKKVLMELQVVKMI